MALYKIDRNMYILRIQGPRTRSKHSLIFVPAFDTKGSKITLPTAKKMVLDELNEKKPGPYEVVDATKVQFDIPGSFITCKVSK